MRFSSPRWRMTSDLENLAATIERKQHQIPERHEQHRVRERRQSAVHPRRKQTPVHDFVQRAETAAEAKLDRRVEENGRQFGTDIRGDWIRAEDREWLCPAPPSPQVDDPR